MVQMETQPQSLSPLDGELEKARANAQSARESKDWWHRKQSADTQNSTLYAVAAKNAEEAWLNAVALVDELSARLAAQRELPVSGSPSQVHVTNQGAAERPTLRSPVTSPKDEPQSPRHAGARSDTRRAGSVGGHSRGSKATHTSQWRSVLEQGVEGLQHSGSSESSPARHRPQYSGYAASTTYSYSPAFGVRSVNGFDFYGDSHSIAQPWTSPLDEPSSPSRRWRDIDTHSRGTLYRNVHGSLTAEGMRICMMQSREVAREREVAAEMAGKIHDTRGDKDYAVHVQWMDPGPKPYKQVERSKQRPSSPTRVGAGSVEGTQR